MTRNGAETVRLTISNWAGIVLTVAGGLAGQWLILNGRVVTLEANQASMRREIDGNEARSEQNRRDVLAEIRSLRQELKANR